MNEFLAFITSGKVESFEDSFKEKIFYLLRIVYYTFALIFSIAIVHQLIIYFQWESVDATLLGIFDEHIDKKTLLFSLIACLIFPVYAGFTLWLCLTRFNFDNVCVSLSLLLTSITSVILYTTKILPKIEGYDFIIIFVFLILFAIFYLIFLNALRKKQIQKLKRFWTRKLGYITCFYILIFVVCNILFVEFNWLNIIAAILIQTITALMLIYVRRLLGLGYAIALHYILLLPIICTIIYLLSV